jgi:integrase
MLESKQGGDELTDHAQSEVIGSSQKRIYQVTDGIQVLATADDYRWIFNRFLTYLRIPNNDLPILLDPQTYSIQTIESRIIDYIRYLSGVRGCKHSTINLHCAAIFHFFEMNDVVLNKRKIKRFLPPDESDHSDKPYTVEQIGQILKNCDERSRVIILLMASTGMRIGALPGLRIGDLTEIPNHNLYKIQVYTRSKKDRYYTFCTPETKIAIDSYFDYRKRFREVLKPESPLIREQFNIDNPFTIDAPKFLSRWGINYIVFQVLKRSGIKTKEVMSSHGFRKHVITMMIKAKVDYEAREYLVGHKHSRGLDVSYDRTTEEDRLAEYKRAIPYLTIDPKQRLEKENQELKSERAEEIAKLKTELREHKEFAIKTAAEISDLKASRGDIQNWEWLMAYAGTNFIKIIDTVNEFRVKNGQEPVATITPEDKEARLRSIKCRLKQIKEGTEFDVPFPEDEGSRAQRIKELELEIKEIEENPNLIIDRLKYEILKA